MQLRWILSFKLILALFFGLMVALRAENIHRSKTASSGRAYEPIKPRYYHLLEKQHVTLLQAILDGGRDEAGPFRRSPQAFAKILNAKDGEKVLWPGHTLLDDYVKKYWYQKDPAKKDYHLDVIRYLCNGAYDQRLHFNGSSEFMAAMGKLMMPWETVAKKLEDGAVTAANEAPSQASTLERLAKKFQESLDLAKKTKPGMLYQLHSFIQQNLNEQNGEISEPQAKPPAALPAMLPMAGAPAAAEPGAKLALPYEARALFEQLFPQIRENEQTVETVKVSRDALGRVFLDLEIHPQVKRIPIPRRGHLIEENGPTSAVNFRPRPYYTLSVEWPSFVEADKVPSGEVVGFGSDQDPLQTKDVDLFSGIPEETLACELGVQEAMDFGFSEYSNHFTTAEWISELRKATGKIRVGIAKWSLDGKHRFVTKNQVPRGFQGTAANNYLPWDPKEQLYNLFRFYSQWKLPEPGQ